MQHLNPEDHYQLRKAQMDADKKALEAEKTQQELERIILDLEHRYGLLATGQVIDPRKASIDGRPSAQVIDPRKASIDGRPSAGNSDGNAPNLTLNGAKPQKVLN